MTALTVPVQRLPHGAALPLPAYATADAAGLDLLAALDQSITLKPIAIALPQGYEAQVRPRSGLAAKHGITVLNSPGTIDADYRGEIKVILVNLGAEPFEIEAGMRIAQMVIAPVMQIAWDERADLESTTRGAGGFGSTGTGGT